jgi:hypothetical protein
MKKNLGKKVALPYIQIDQVLIGGIQSGPEADIYRLHMLAFHWCWTAAMGAKSEGFALCFNFGIWGQFSDHPFGNGLNTGLGRCRVYKSHMMTNINFGKEIIQMTEPNFMRAYALHFGESLRYIKETLNQRKRQSNIDDVIIAYEEAVTGFLSLKLPFRITQEELSHLAIIVLPEHQGWVRMPLQLTQVPSGSCRDLAMIFAQLLEKRKL